MSEGGEIEIDLSNYVEPPDLDAAWTTVLADLRGDEDHTIEAPEASGVTADTGEALPPGFDEWTDYQREDWAWGEHDLLRGEERRRRDLLAEWEREHKPESVRRVTREASGWGDVPLDGILNDVEAGTLVLPAPTVGMLSDGSGGLFYSGRVNGLAGESGAGKGWIALAVSIEQMKAGHHVYYLDFEDSPALAVLRLVRVLGADVQLVRAHFHYAHPARHDDEGVADLVERVASTPDAFVVIDSTGESIAAAGLNQNTDEDVARWFQSLAHPLADKGGATVVLLDHKVKSEDGGLWPIGSQRKRAAITGAQYVAEVRDAFGKTKDGMVELRVAKDRHGAREARSIASYVRFEHPIESITTLPDGSTDVVLSEALNVVFGVGKTADQIKAASAAKAATKTAAIAAAKLDQDVAELDRLNPPPRSQRDVLARTTKWGGPRAMDALQEWRKRQQGGAS